ncbi:hypothetical protein P5E91_07720 [Clostridium perfringens]|nr:hypothetical protein [Clostridium perfringens]
MIRKTAAMLAIFITLSTSNVFAIDIKINNNSNNKQEKSVESYNQKASENNKDKINEKNVNEAIKEKDTNIDNDIMNGKESEEKKDNNNQDTYVEPKNNLDT